MTTLNEVTTAMIADSGEFVARNKEIIDEEIIDEASRDPELLRYVGVAIGVCMERDR